MEEKFLADDLITTKDAAKIIGTTAENLRQWRKRKLFGVPFFTADVMKNGAWYYERERVEQLAAVYQEGTLQSMYKLARKFEGEEVKPFDFCVTSEGHFKLAKVTPSYYPAEEVAKLLGVDEKTIDRWRESRKFVEDVQGHDGVYWYSAARVYAKKAELDSKKSSDVAQHYVTEIHNLLKDLAGLNYKPKTKFYRALLVSLSIEISAGKSEEITVINTEQIIKLADVLKAAGISANIVEETDEINGCDVYEKWTITNFSDVDLFIQSARKYLESELNVVEKAQSTNDLYTKLNAVKAKLEEIDAKSKAAIERLKNVETFDHETVFAAEIVMAGAYAKIFDRQAYSEFTLALKNYGDKHKENKVPVNDWKAAVKDVENEISSEREELLSRQNRIINAIETEKFLAANQDLDCVIPDGYAITSNGVVKIDGKKSLLCCRVPVVISGKTKSVEDKSYKLILQCRTKDGKSKYLPAMPASTIFNRATIINLTNYGLLTSSHTSSYLVDYLDAFHAENDSRIPVTCTVPKCGWYNFGDKDIFVDPRRNNTVTDDENLTPLIVESSSQFAQNLTSKGTLENWKRAYELAKTSSVARFMVAAAVAAPLLKVLGERNFLIYVKAHTRAGKTTALLLGASTVGTEKIVRSFDATPKGLTGAAADVNDYSFLVDEKQVADYRLAEQFQTIVYALANGTGRLRLNHHANVKPTDYWRTIAILTGETDLLNDNVTGGAYSRSLQLNAPKVILSPDACKDIRRIIQKNYGLVMPLIIDKIFECGFDNLLAYYAEIQTTFAKKFPDVLSEYQRYIAILTLADVLLNSCLGVDTETAFNAALENASKIFDLVPTRKDIDDTTREIEMVQGFIAQNQSRFIGGNVELDKMQQIKMQQIYGRIESTCVYITVAALKIACKESGFNYSKVVTDLIDVEAFVPYEREKKDCKTPLKTHQKKIGGVKVNCYKFIDNAD